MNFWETYPRYTKDPHNFQRHKSALIRYNGSVINLDDTELVAKVADGDERAFLVLYDRYASRVHALTLRILGEPMLAEEATQDTFFKLWSRARQYLAERGSLLVWLLTIARRTALDRLRLEGRRPTLSDSEDPETTWQSIASEDSLTSEARWRSMYFAVQSLPEEQRQVIELAFYQGMSQSEIAEVLGWPLGTVKSRMRSAMESLRREWRKDDSE
ncbi:MAG: sigma-70 family RNA polymerase sigma factor [Chloroflexi bacterium]|nr:sigma-70 family RNA polymerase sigma factor [Chloroflexota bacterium]